MAKSWGTTMSWKKVSHRRKYFLNLTHTHKYLFYITKCLIKNVLIGWKRQCSPLTSSPLVGSSLPDSQAWQSTVFQWLTAWSQTRLHTQEGQGQAPGAGEEKPLCYQGSDAAGHTPVTPGHPNVASFCAHAQGCTIKSAETTSNNMQTNSCSSTMCTNLGPATQI